MGKIILLNKKTDSVDTCEHNYPGQVFYIGRPSPLGNPYPVSMGRDRCIAKYKIWLRNIIAKPSSNLDAYEYLNEIYKAYSTYDTIYLVCYCSPKPCHGDAIRTLIEEVDEEHRQIQEAMDKHSLK